MPMRDGRPGFGRWDSGDGRPNFEVLWDGEKAKNTDTLTLTRRDFTYACPALPVPTLMELGHFSFANFL